MSFREQLPRPIRRIGRRLAGRSQRFEWEGDGFATSHFSPFLADPEWATRYEYMRARWLDTPMDVRWRMWVLTSAAKQAQALDGAFAEFGSYRGGCAYMMLASTSGTPMWLYDTFDGIPSVGLDEREQSMARRYADTSVQAVRDLLAEWDERITLVAGDVFNTLPTNDPGPLAMSHLDLNAAAPTVHALGFAYERTVPGGVLLFDDYGWGGYEAQREVVDRFFAERPEAIIALPTGQALVTKLR